MVLPSESLSPTKINNADSGTGSNLSLFSSRVSGVCRSQAVPYLPLVGLVTRVNPQRWTF